MTLFSMCCGPHICASNAHRFLTPYFVALFLETVDALDLHSFDLGLS